MRRKEERREVSERFFKMWTFLDQQIVIFQKVKKFDFPLTTLQTVEALNRTLQGGLVLTYL